MSRAGSATGLVVGLTGGIGSGKRAAAGCFAAPGAAIVDTDAIAHELTGPAGAPVPALIAAFGTKIRAADGSLDRTSMRRLVFDDPAARRRLEAILHPLIRQESTLHCRQAAVCAPYVVLVVPLLVESADYRQRVQRIAVVDCSDETRIQRVAIRSGLTRDEIERIMATQASREARLALADDVIDNNGDPTELSRQVAQLHSRYLQIAADTAKNTITG
jgi:dephospho-CoA kinase